MNTLLIKKWTTLLVAFALLLQVWAPAAYAMEDETEGETEVKINSETEIKSEGSSDVDVSSVTSDDAVDTLDNLLEEEGNDDNEIDSIIDELLNDVNTDQEAEDLISKVEQDTKGIIAELEKEATANPLKKLKIAKKILQHKAFLLRLRARLIMHHNKIIGAVKNVRDGRRLYHIRWGVLNQDIKDRCPGLNREEIKTSLDADETPACDVVKADYQGSISVDKGSLNIKKEMLFEKNDEVVTSSGSSVEWTSHIAGHWDGLMVEYTPDDTEGEVAVTISIGDFNETLKGADSMGRKAIGNGHFIEIKPLAAGLAGVTNKIQDRMVENKIKIQEKTDKIRDRLKRLGLLRLQASDDVSGEFKELEGVLDDIEEYNFDDTSNAEISAEVDSLSSVLTDGTSKVKVQNQLQRLRGMLVTIKDKAKDRKFAEKMIPFKDTDDNEWYTKYVAPMKEKGIVSGYKDSSGHEIGEYRPGSNVTVAETLKIGLETSNNGQSDGAPALQGAFAHWAKAYVKRSEELGLDITNENIDLNRPATRAEVIRMMLEAAGLNPDAAQGSSFDDVSANHPHAAFIALAKKLGIISGDDGANTFRPDAPINRAEVAKIANQIMEILLGQ